jgi:hypothetical protein
MSEEESSARSVLEIHEEFLQRVETGSTKIKTLSVITIAVSALLAVLYVYEIASPFLSGVTVVTVNLRDPGLVALELLLTVLALVWLYVGVRDYRYVARLARSIRQARALESAIEREISGNQGTS